jgi:hypothetical protein
VRIGSLENEEEFVENFVPYLRSREKIDGPQDKALLVLNSVPFSGEICSCEMIDGHVSHCRGCWGVSILLDCFNWEYEINVQGAGKSWSF